MKAAMWLSSLIILFAPIPLYSSNRINRTKLLATQISPVSDPVGLGIHSRNDEILTSIEVYASHDESHDALKSQIISWTTEELSTRTKDFCTFATVLSPLDKKRLVKVIGWGVKGNLMTNVDIRFDKFRDRASSENGVPLSLQESTHLYETLFSLPPSTSTAVLAKQSNTATVTVDIFTCRHKEDVGKVISKLIDALKSVEETMNTVMDNAVSLQVLSAIDSAVCVLLCVWKSSEGYLEMTSLEDFNKRIMLVKELAAEGTFSDIIEKSNPRRLFKPCTFFTTE